METRSNVTRLMFLVLCATGTAVAADVKSASLNVSQATEVPGGELKPGAYSIGVVDSLTDRVVVRIDGRSGKTHLLFLGVRKQSGSEGSDSHAVQWTSEASHKHFLRGYTFGSDYIEFVYPKDDAVAIAKANNTGVVAVDPKSESRPELNKLTAQDRQMISLWMLTPVQVGPSPGIEAKHYTGSANTQVASSNTATSGASQTTSTTSTSSQATSRTSAPVQVARLDAPAKPRAYRPALKRLPQTGSEMPLLWGLGFTTLCAASAMRFRKLTA